ncbi:sensor histidine kinase [Oceanispirochaeta sp. M1]|uniref:sensor histidine kinase n=1 Tax=Oceanispirochaeta sp. M1 TaxID=2283433 RepID=UPI0011C06BAD|nr:sensor histidine kinase [Oceanispirochaeta sp. M1]
MIEEKASESFLQYSFSITDRIDSEIQDLDSIALKLISSKDLKELFFSDDISFSKELQKKWDITDLLFSISGPSLDFFQINLFNLKNGDYVKFGKIYDTFSGNKEYLNSIPWVLSTIEMNGKRLLTSPHPDEMESPEIIVISVSRAFSEVFGAKLDSIIEVQQSYDLFFNYIEKMIPPADEEGKLKVYIFDSFGKLVYPYQDSTGKFNDSLDIYWSNLASRDEQLGSFRMDNGFRKEKDIVSFSRSEQTGWTVVVVESEGELLKPLGTFRNNLIQLGILILIITMFLTYFVSRGLTVPIKKMRNSINNLSLQALDLKSDKSENLNELEELNDAFMKMCLRLKESLEEVVAARSHETRAQLYALQAQMNPHFLYNILSIISIKAEQSNQLEIHEMCSNLSQMMRYIGNESPKPVSLSEEIQYMIKYLNLMKIRYMNQFEYEINIRGEIEGISVPRMIIQPIVENCFKYAFDIKPMWKIDVTGEVDDNFWKISIRDNGPGFDKSELNRIQQQIRDTEYKYFDDNAEKNSIGLMNIYYRLKLLYGENAVFEISNMSEKGATVTVGGLRTSKKAAV